MKLDTLKFAFRSGVVANMRALNLKLLFTNRDFVFVEPVGAPKFCCHLHLGFISSQFAGGSCSLRKYLHSPKSYTEVVPSSNKGGATRCQQQPLIYIGVPRPFTINQKFDTGYYV